MNTKEEYIFSENDEILQDKNEEELIEEIDVEKKSQIMKEANNLCIKIYSKSFFEVFGCGEFTDIELQSQIKFLKEKLEFQQQSEEIVEEDDKIREKNFFDIWRKSWNEVIADQETLCELYALVALSQIFKDKRIYRGVDEDLRLHLCAIMPSGSGKSEGNDFLNEFAEAMELNLYPVDRYNDAVLTGSIDRSTIEYNNKNKYSSSDDEWMNPYSPSILETRNFIVYDEGENILKTTQMTQGAQRLLQKAMNRTGSKGNEITNTLIGYEVKTHPECSVIITSYYISEFRDVLLTRGLFQRMIVFIREEDKDMRTRIIHKIVDGIPEVEDDIQEAIDEIRQRIRIRKGMKDSLVKESLRLIDHHEDLKYLAIQKGVKDIIYESIDQLRNLMPFLLGQQKIWESMVSRVTISILKIAGVHALANYRNIITKEDAAYASSILMKTMKSMAFFLTENVKTTDDIQTEKIYKHLKAKYIGKNFTRENWIKIISNTFGMSDDKSDLVLVSLLKNDKFLRLNKKGTDVLRLKV